MQNSLYNLLQGTLKTFDKAQWLRVNEVIDNTPIPEVVEKYDDGRISITEEMYDILKEKISDRGDFSGRQLSRLIEQYEAANSLKTTGCKEAALFQLMRGERVTFDKAQWQRLNEVIDSLPVKEGEKRIAIDPKTLKAKIKKHGNLGTMKLWRTIAKYEEKKSKPSVGLSREIINQIIIGRVKTIKTSHLLRINEVLESLPVSQELNETITIQPAELAALNAKIIARGNYRAVNLTNAIKQYEVDKKLSSANLDLAFLHAVLSGKRKFAKEFQWKRLEEFVDSLPEKDARRIETISEIDTFKKKLSERGITGARPLLQKVREYEKRHKLTEIGLGEVTLYHVLRGSIKSLLDAEWQRLNNAVDALPIAPLPARIEVTESMRSDFRAKIAAQGEFTIPQLIQKIRDHEAQKNKVNININRDALRNILKGKAKTADELLWLRVNEVIDSLGKKKAKNLSNISKPTKNEIIAAAKSQPTGSAPVTRQDVADLFAQLSGNLVDRIAAEFAQKMQGQQPLVSAENSHVPSLGQSGAGPSFQEAQGKVTKTTRARKPKKQPEMVAAPVPDADPVVEVPVVVPPVESFEIAPLTKADVAAMLPSEPDVTALPRGIDFAALKTPLLHRKDAAGDSMITCLQNAQRDFVYENRVGMRANLRKFVELFAHNFIAVAESHLEKMQMPNERRGKAIKIIHNYHYDCAKVQVTNAEKHNGNYRARVQLSDRMDSWRKLLDILGAASPEQFPVEGLARRSRELTAVGNDIHIRLDDTESATDAQLLQNGFELARWFDMRFRNDIEIAPPEKPVDAAPDSVTDALSDNKPEQPAAGATLPPEPPAVEPATALAIKPSILKTLGVTAKQFEERASGPEAQGVAVITGFVQEWGDEDAKTKVARNKLIRGLYTEVMPQVEVMIRKGKSIEAITASLNKDSPSRDPETGRVLTWTPNHLLRGAVLNHAVLPLDSFLSVRGAAFTAWRNRQTRTPKP